MKDARDGVATLPANFVRERLDGQDHFFVPSDAVLTPTHQTTFLLPDYDEYGISYKNRSALFVSGPPVSAGNGTYPHALVVESVAAGTWKRTPEPKNWTVDIHPFAAWTALQQQAVDEALRRYQAFWG